MVLLLQMVKMIYDFICCDSVNCGPEVKPGCVILCGAHYVIGGRRENPIIQFGGGGVALWSDLGERIDAERVGIPVRRAAIIANGIDLEDVLVSGDSPENPVPEPFVLYLGRINWKKGLDRFEEFCKTL